MKHNRFGQARVLLPEELDTLVNLLPPGAHRTLGHLLRRTSVRVSEGLKLKWEFILDDVILFPAPITKRKKSRPIPLHPILKTELEIWKDIQVDPKPSDFVFKGRLDSSHLTRQSFDLVLRQACESMGIKGVSTHSFRRSCLTHLNNHKVPLRTIQSISGHSSLAVLEKYLEVTEKDRVEAISLL